MTRPMTSQPATDEELTNATQNANAELNKMLENGDIERGFDDEDEQTDEDKIEDLRDFREQVREEGNDELGVYGEPQTDEPEMEVTENGETETYTRDEWDARPDTRMRTWKRMARDDLMFVRVARWFNNEDMNRVQTGRGFYGDKVGETDKALKFEVPVGEGLSAQAETVWVPKKAVRTHELI